MADRKVVGWFWRNGHRIPIFEKRERDVKEGTYQGKSVTVGSEVDVPGGKGTVQRLYETSNPDLMYKNRIKIKNNKTGDEIDMANGDELNPKFGKTGLRKPLSPNSVKARDRKSRNEILEYDHDAAKAFEGIFDVESPREVANSMGKRVRTSDGKIVRPVKRSGMDLETRVNNDIGRNPEAYGITPESKVNDAVAESVGKELASKSKRGGKGQPRPRREKADPALLDANVPKYLKSATGSQTPGYEGRETAFTDSRGERQWAKNVDSLPEKKNKFSNGYGKLGSTETRDIYADRDSTDGAYYAVPRSAGARGGKKNSTGKASIKKPAESYIKSVMEERGLTRTEALKYIKEQRKKK